MQIRVETVVSVVLLCIAVVLSSAELRPVKWREWTNSQELENPGYDLVNFSDFIVHRIFLNTGLDSWISEPREGHFRIRKDCRNNHGTEDFII